MPVRKPERVQCSLTDTLTEGIYPAPGTVAHAYDSGIRKVEARALAVCQVLGRPRLCERLQRQKKKSYMCYKERKKVWRGGSAVKSLPADPVSSTHIS